MIAFHRINRWGCRSAALGAAGLLAVTSAQGQTRTWTLDEDFDEGTLVNVNHDITGQLQLDDETTPFPFINVAASLRGTIVRIDTETGAIIGEYRTAPEGRFRNPSRTTVDLFGNVWAGNRDEADGGLGSVVKIGLIVGGTRVDADGTPNPTGQYLAPPFDYNTCVDRDGDGLIKTSYGLTNILPWPDITDGAGGVTALVEDAEDECILIYQRVTGNNVRHVSVDANNNVWAGGHLTNDNAFDLLDGNDGRILASFNVGLGGYGGLVDGNGVLWSTHRTPAPVTVLRYDTKGTIMTADDTWSTLDMPNAYGLGLDSFGDIWCSQWTLNRIRECDSAGNLTGDYPSGGASSDRGVTITPADDDVWVANSGGSDVSRLDQSGALLKVIPLGADGVTPTGVAVDADGKVWVTCLNSHTAKRIDPNAGGDGLGAVDLTVSLGAGAGPYNYSDMTGQVLLAAVRFGTWTVVYDSGMEGTPACALSWNSDEPMGTSITVEVRAAETIAGLPSEVFVPVLNGDPALGIAGRYWEIQVTFGREPDVEVSPVLYDLTIGCVVDGYLDIKPGSCPNSFNRKSKGVTPVALVGAEEFDVTEVDPSSLVLSRLDGMGGSVAPIRMTFDDVATPFMGEPCDCHEMHGDGYMDLSMKFSTPALVDQLELGGLPGREMVPLVLSGTFYDGTQFEAVDCIRLVPARGLRR